MPPEDRIRIVHMIEAIREIVWKTATDNIPSLLPLLRALLPTEE